MESRSRYLDALVLAVLGSIPLVVGLFMLSSGNTTLARLANDGLEPGYWWPRHYWGGVHDPLQVLLVFALNVVFYGGLLFCVLAWRAATGPSAGSPPGRNRP